MAFECFWRAPPMIGHPSARSHSYQGQDLFVLEILDGMRGGFFVDSGASNGVNGSNTKLLEEEFGWTGLCIEPNADLFAQLVRNRNCVCLDYCIYDREGSVEFVEVANVYGGILEQYDPEHLRLVTSMLGAGGQLPTRLKPARTIGSVLREHAAPAVVDYWSLDTEGSELSILRSFPFDEYVVRVLTVEHNYSPARERLRGLLERRGYVRVGSLGIDDCYLWRSGFPLPAWRSRAWTRAGTGGGDRRRAS
ncbi:MAG: FkbM family methyltransferase [Actinomycetota bacterium]|nr:FkbM family methyltransferase [Actinomycetota bacterium]